MSDGVYEHVDIDRRDEIGCLATSFNTATAIIKEKFGVSEGIMRGMTLAFATCDTNGRLTFVNQKMLDLWGREGTPRDVVGMTAGEFFHNDPSHPTLFGRVLEDPQPILGYTAARTNARGEKKYMMMDFSPLHDLDGKLIGAFTLHSDLTEIHEQREHVAQLNDRIYFSANMMVDSLTDAEYDEAEQYLFDSGIEDGFVQEKDSASKSFIPSFHGEGVLPQ